ncbi:hypothetical protein evm_001937 [Chilo suppressalis]|nr:hypothetical protein evm_001937 [Chilo suppressalis]
MEARRISTLRQLEMLLDFVAVRKDLALGRHRSKEARAISARLWRQCAKQLNSAGPTRTPKEWSRVWNDMKCRVRSKMSSHALSQQSDTGGGANNSVTFTGMEARVANIIGCDISSIANITQSQVFLEDSHVEVVRSPDAGQQESNEFFVEIKKPTQLLSQSSPREISPPHSSSSSSSQCRSQSSPRRRRRKESHKPYSKSRPTALEDDSCGVVLKLEEMRAHTENLLAQASLRQAEAAKAQAEAAVMTAEAELLRTQTMAKLLNSLDSLVPAVRRFLERRT